MSLVTSTLASLQSELWSIRTELASHLVTINGSIGSATNVGGYAYDITEELRQLRVLFESALRELSKG